LAVTDHGHFRIRGGGKIALTAVLIAALGLLLLLSVAIPVKAVEQDELTVITMAQDGSWGVHGGLAWARDCSGHPRLPGDVQAVRAIGGSIHPSRGGWVIVDLCCNQKSS
jgi:hypothetical protein